MNLRFFSPLKSEYIIYDDLKEKLVNIEFVYFSEQDFKSLLALSFAIELWSLLRTTARNRSKTSI
jgi:hypothetical protein